MKVEASPFLGLKIIKNPTEHSPAILPFFGKWQKFTLERELFSTIRAGEVTSDSPLRFPGIPY